MRVLFINIAIRPNSPVKKIPVGLAYVLTAVENVGIDFDFIDMDIDNISMNNFKKILHEKKYDIYSFGTIVSSFRIAKEIAQIIRNSNPSAIIIAGNSVASSIPETLMEHTEVDIGIIGEADITIVELLMAYKNKNNMKTVPGIFYRENNVLAFSEPRPVEKNIDIFAFPNWELFNLKKYDHYSDVNTSNFLENDIPQRWMPLNTGRGCPYNCSFCYITVRDNKIRYRRYSEEAIINEIKRLHFKYGATYISFWDDLAFPNKSTVKKIISLILKLNFKFYWNAPIRGDLFNKNDIDLLQEVKKSGCVDFGFSLENADDKILKAINKHLNIDQFIDQAKILKKVNIIPRTSVIFGYPQETPESIKKTLAVCEEAGVYPSVGFLLALPGTPIYKQLRQEGWIPNEYEYLMKIGDRQDFSLNFTSMSNKQFIYEVTNGLSALAKRQGLSFSNPLKTIHYQKPKNTKLQ